MITDRRLAYTPDTGCQMFTPAMTVMPGTPLQCFGTSFGGVLSSQFLSYFGQLTFNIGLVTQRRRSPDRSLFPPSSEQPYSFMVAWSSFEGRAAKLPIT